MLPKRLEKPLKTSRIHECCLTSFIPSKTSFGLVIHLKSSEWPDLYYILLIIKINFPTNVIFSSDSSTIKLIKYFYLFTILIPIIRRKTIIILLIASHCFSPWFYPRSLIIFTCFSNAFTYFFAPCALLSSSPLSNPSFIKPKYELVHTVIYLILFYCQQIFWEAFCCIVIRLSH